MRIDITKSGLVWESILSGLNFSKFFSRVARSIRKRGSLQQWSKSSEATV